MTSFGAFSETLRVCPLPFSAYSFGDAYVLDLGPGTTPVRVSSVEMHILRLLIGARPLSAHIDAICRAMNSVSAPLANAMLLSFLDRGLLRLFDMRDWPDVDSLAPAPPQGIDIVALLTCDAPDACGRSLNSIRDHCREFGYSPVVLVVDASAHPDRAGRTRSIVDSFRPEFSTLRYVSTAQICDAILAQPIRIDPLLVARSFNNSLTGAVNCILAITRSKRFLALTNGVSLAALGSTERRPVITVSGDARWSLLGRQRSLRSLIPVNVDVFAALGVLLGKTVGRLVRTTSGDPDLSQACSHLMSAAITGTPCSVRVVSFGVAVTTERSLDRWQAPPSIPDIVPSSPTGSSESDDMAAMDGSYVVSHGNTLAGSCFALVNTDNTPPFVPSDSLSLDVFGDVLKNLDPTAIFGSVPFALAGNQHSSTFLPQTSFGVRDIVRLAVDDCVADIPQSIEPTSRAAKLSAYLLQLSRLSPLDFESWVRARLLDTFAKSVEFSTPLAPEPLRDRLAMDAVDAIATFLRPARPSLVGDGDANGGTVVQTGVACYASLLAAWDAVTSSTLHCDFLR